MFRSGFKHELQGRNWRQLALKLATPGSNVTVAVFGGSVTVGHYPSCDNSSWVEEAWHWMEAAFPDVHFNFVHLGHGATSANVASLCYYQDLPAEADMVLVEYSLNGCGALQCLRISQPEVAAYENLLRKIILRAPHAALLSFAAFAWKIDEVGDEPPYTSVPNPFWNTGEDQHAILAKRYGVPMVSVRDALYDVLFYDDVAKAKLGMTRAEMMHDHVHPQLPGAHLYGAGFVAWAIRHLVTLELMHSSSHSGAPVLARQTHTRHIVGSRAAAAGSRSSAGSSSGRSQRQLLYSYDSSSSSSSSSSSGSDGAYSEDSSYLMMYNPHSPDPAEWQQPDAPPPLPPFVSPRAAQQVDDDTFCAAGEDLSKHKVANMGWKWVDEGRRTCSHPGCRKYGWTSKTPGSYIEFEFDSSSILSEEQARNGHAISLVMLFLRSHGNNPNDEQGSKYGMGTALITCVSGCECEPLKVDAVNTDRASELDTIRTTVSAHPHCRVRATILSETSSGGHKFRINGLALAPFNSALPMGRFDRMLFDKEYLVMVQRFDSMN
ncbi:hypothetical protein OEZ86_013827 [Tetradesmus obliquus]|nr:hypothetical protein OEZ86_013827 [Tetradesmus obliquus]